VKGAKQGSPASSHLSAIALQPILRKKSDEKLKKQGGFLASIADDVYLCGPPKAVAMVYPEYKEDLKEIGSTLNEPKNAALLGTECELPADFSIRRGAIYDGPTGKTMNLVGHGIVCVGVPLGDAPFIRRYLELKETGEFKKNRPHNGSTPANQQIHGAPADAAVSASQVDFLARTMDPSVNTAGCFSRFDQQVQNTVAECTSQGREWPGGDTPHLSGDDWGMIGGRFELPKKLGGWGFRSRMAMSMYGHVVGTVNCVNLGLGKPGTPGASKPLFPPSTLERMTPHSDSRMRLQAFLDLGTERGEAFKRVWE
jgi:hypothetical protein